MTSFNNYTHQESVVQAVKLDQDTTSDISAALGGELTKGLLASFQATYNSTNKCYEYTFRYKTDSVDSNLTAGNYLVQLNTSNYVVRDAETFEEEYLPTYEDEALMPSNPQTPMQAMITFIKKYYPDIEITGDTLDSAQLGQVLEGLKSWYNEEADQFTIHFNHTGMVDPTGLADFFKAFPQASYLKDTTTYVLDLSNGGVVESDANTENNLFNAAGLDQLYGELMKLDADVVKKLVKLDLSSVDDTAPSAVAPSVTDSQWLEFCTNVMSISGITTIGDIRR